MTIAAAPEVVIVRIPLIPGVSGLKVMTTRTETTISGPLSTQDTPVHAPLGRLPASVQRMNTLLELTDPKGATIRLTAATTSAWRLPGPVTVDGQVGPPTA